MVFFVVKVVGVLIVSIVVKIMGGKLLIEFDLCYVKVSCVVVKEVVFLFVCFVNVDLIFGFEMCLMGEVMGWDDDFGMVFLKFQIGVGVILLISGCVFILLWDFDKEDIVEVVRSLIEMGFEFVVMFGMVVFL